MAKAKPLGRRAPSDWRHYEKYPLTAATTPTTPTPVAIGVNWYEDFDTPGPEGQPLLDRTRAKKLGKVRGGHCVCLEPGDQLNGNGTVVRLLQDSQSSWDFYDQGREGACVGFGCSRMMSLLNRKRYDARWLWDWASPPTSGPIPTPATTRARACARPATSCAHAATCRGRSLPRAAVTSSATRRSPAPARASASTVGEDRRGGPRDPQEPRQQRRRRRAHPQLVGARLPASGVDARRDAERLIDEDGEVALVTDR